MKDYVKVLDYGATGSQARQVVHHLLANGHEAFGLTRNPASEEAHDS